MTFLLIYTTVNLLVVVYAFYRDIRATRAESLYFTMMTALFGCVAVVMDHLSGKENRK